MDINSYTSVKSWLTNHINQSFNKQHTDFNLLHTLIQNHPNYHDWKLNNPLMFKIVFKKYLQLMVSFQPKKFRIVSWVRCCKKIKPQDSLTSAMRQAIRRQITMYKRQHPSMVCHVCQSLQKIEVDHYPIQFVTIKDDFLLNHIAPTQFRFHPKRGYSMFQKQDTVWKKSWQKYHLKIANYRYLCSTCNKKRLS